MLLEMLLAYCHSVGLTVEVSVEPEGCTCEFLYSDGGEVRSSVIRWQSPQVADWNLAYNTAKFIGAEYVSS